ncbi:Protein of unknown function DUF262 [Streptococcus henryi]|uniref:GmrSD restriction endonucleases N-terminal domain-containing protein n=1 Tax=Streptococcus henryi TaxID=439219 RepID=A0A1G6DI29_9STRE|nr:DUF262 domain-containing protein [Streptococcus henryi]SDB44759.1 Protein of unknown function DUF262 [Streptococcus henryi]
MKNKEMIVNNKVFYGEYSLQHWIDLILKRNVILPDYQRNFVWTEEKRNKLIKSLKNQEFIPPVIIGSFNNQGIKENILIDGQQRLTSILLSSIGYFPDREKYKKEKRKVIAFIDESDNVENSILDEDVIDWSFSELLEEKNTINSLRKKLESKDFFKKIDGPILSEEFLKNTYLGFSYLVPYNNKKDYQQKYYSSVFRNINIQGEKLLAQESRAPLYYLDSKKKTFFDPEFFSKNLFGNTKLDFVRYLAILSFYEKHKTDDILCRGYGNKLEDFYEHYIYSIVQGGESKEFISYSELFNNGSHEKIISKLEKVVSELKIFDQKYDSIIDLDLIFFGLIYRIVFEKKNIDYSKSTELFNLITETSQLYKNPIEHIPAMDSSGKIDYLPINNYHYKNPSALKYITKRVKKSLEIYSKLMGD